jgi:hypothetical protein
MNTIFLPVSLGEALDKLTILEIKLDKIQDERRADVLREYEELLKTLETYKKKHAYFYRILKDSNLTIWNLQESFHGKEAPSAEVCQQILTENDRRFRIKKKINHGSVLQEQKGYAKKNAFVFGHLGLGDMIWLNGAVRYLATKFDGLVVVSKKDNARNMFAMYADDPTIEMLFINDFEDLYPWWVQNREGQIIRRVNIDFTFFECGIHALKDVINLPQSFYEDMNIPYEYARSYFHIPRSPANDILAAHYKDIPYIIIHENSSEKCVCIYRTLKDSGCLILDISKNNYKPDHPWYTLAQQTVGLPLFDYMSLLEGARELHLIESSLFCLACHLDLSRVAVRKCYIAYGEGAMVRTKGLFEDAKVYV